MLSKNARRYNLLVGALDTSTGILLMLAPELTLHLMLISQIPTELVYLRFIGAFVFATGFSYFLPRLFCSAKEEAATIGVWAYTAWARAVISVFVLSQVLTGGLELMWLSVAVCDAFFALCQIHLIRSHCRQSER